jgi:hypothetical protein
MSDNGFGYICMIPGIVVGHHPLASLAAVFVLAAGAFGGGMAFQSHIDNGSSHKKSDIVLSLSSGRQQLLDQEIAGSPQEFQNFLNKEAGDYFTQKGFPVDPGPAASTVGETIAKAKQTPAP